MNALPWLAAFIAAALAMSLAAAASAVAATAWDELVAAANGEGEVDVHGGPGKLYEQVLTEGFRRAFPQIKVVLFSKGSSSSSAHSEDFAFKSWHQPRILLSSPDTFEQS